MRNQFNLEKLTEIIGGELIGDHSYIIKTVNSITKAKEDEISFLVKDIDVSKIKVGAIIVSKDSKIKYHNLIYVDSPYKAFAKLLELFYPKRTFYTGIHSDVWVAKTSVLGKNVNIGPYSTIGDFSKIGNNTEIHSGVKIYHQVKIGKNCLIYSNVIIREDVIIGDRVIIHSGAVIGADGFGFNRMDDGTFIKIPQKGRVVIEDNCEIGANACIDRSTIDETRIGKDVKIDNLVQIGHNVKVGQSTAISALTGISGSVNIGKFITIGGQVGIADHISIADGTMIAGKTGVTGSIKEKDIIAGYPHKNIKKWRKEQVILRNIDNYIKRIKALEKRLEEVEGKK